MLVYYVASTLDGFIAGPQDDLSWLPTSGEYGYDAFYASIDAVVMGRGTYDISMSMGAYPYEGKPAMLLASKKPDNLPAEVRWTNAVADVQEFVRQQEGRTWLVGGSQLAAALADQIEEIHLTIFPVLIGEGVPLWRGPLTKFHLLAAEQIPATEAVTLRYRRNELS